MGIHAEIPDRKSEDSLSSRRRISAGAQCTDSTMNLSYRTGADCSIWGQAAPFCPYGQSISARGGSLHGRGTAACRAHDRLSEYSVHSCTSERHVGAAYGVFSACTDKLGHVPAKCEVIGGDYIEYRFDSWVNAVRSFFSGRMASAKTPPPFAERQIVRDTLAALEAQP